MYKVKLLSTAAAAALLFGIASASATTDAPVMGKVQLAQTDTGTSGGTGADTGGSGSDTGPQSEPMEPETGVSPDMSTGDAETGTGTGTGTTTGTGTEPSTTTGQTGDTTPMTEQELATRADEIIGQPVVNQQGEDIGEINDLVVDDNNQPYAIVGVGGFLGIGERNTAVPVSSLDFGADQIVYNGMGTVDEFKTMPEYEDGTWRSLKQ